MVTIVVISPLIQEAGKPDVIITEVIKANLSMKKERVRHLARMIRLVRVLRYLERIIPKDVDHDMISLIR
jgi:hypothetical protein